MYKQKKNLIVSYKPLEKFKKLGLSSKEIKEYLKGEDVVLYKKDFNRLKVNRK